jgi:REP element-mobilizing transposase RayT
MCVLMPDHIHLILDFSEALPMTKAIRDWKSYLAKPWQCLAEKFL